MTEDDVVRIVRAYIEGLFPKVCPKCGLRFNSLRDYLQLTTHMGSPHFFEPAADDLAPDSLLGPIAHATCPCHYTLTIGSEGIPKNQLAELINWATAESQRRSITTTALMRHLRDRIDEEVLQTTQDAPQERRARDRGARRRLRHIG